MERDGITITDKEKKRHYLKQLKRNKIFDKNDWGSYNSKATNQKGWNATKAHFQKLYKVNKKFKDDDEAATIRGGGYGGSGLESAMLAREQYEQNQQAIKILQEIKDMQANNNNNTPPIVPYCQPVEDTANAVVGGSNDGSRDTIIQGLMKTMATLTASVEKLQQGQNNKPPPGRENANPNTTFSAPPCKHCGKSHPGVPNHWLGTEAECPGRDWPNNVKGHIADGVDYFVKRMNKRTGKDYKPNN